MWKRAIFFFMLILLVTKGFANANNSDSVETYTSLDELGAGSLVIKGHQNYQSFLRLNTEFNVTVNGLVSQVTLRQTFKNPGRQWVEATYALPLPENSAVNGMRIEMDDRVIVGEIMEKQQAKRAYVQAKNEGKQAGLVQQQRPNMFSTQVANIAPEAIVVVELTFFHTLPYRSGQFELRLPMTVTPRFIPGISLHNDDINLDVQGWAYPTDIVSDAHLITPPQTRSVPFQSHQAQLNIQINSGFDVEKFVAPYHRIQTSRTDDDYRIKTEQPTVSMDRDFVLQWRPVAQQMPVAAFFTEQTALDAESNATHGLFMMLPPLDDQAVIVPDRELILILDTSGSMSGASIEQAKQSVQWALQQLRPQDWFNVIEFNSDYRQLFTGLRQADASNLDKAQHFVERLSANGGTQMYAPLNAAMTTSSPQYHDDTSSAAVRQIVFITDGSVGNEHQLLELISNRIADARLYTVGIGSAPNTYFMRKSAEWGRGTYTYIGDQSEVHHKMNLLFEKIEKPVLTHVAIRVEGAQADWYPKKIPDLYAGEPLLIAAKFDAEPSAIMVSGILNGQPWQSYLNVRSHTDSEGVATVWARSKVAHLQDEGIKNGNAGLFRNEILTMGLAYKIITPYTSFLAVEQVQSRPYDSELQSKSVPNLMPAGSTQAAPTVGYPKTALSIGWQQMMAYVLLLVAFLIWFSGELKKPEAEVLL